MREITTHKVNGCNEAITVYACDKPGQGGACHQYRIMHSDGIGTIRVDLGFQNGPIKEVGTNGLTHEVLLAVVIDRLKSFQAGPYACNENMHALVKLTEAMHWLHSRTRARVDRGVEGTHEK